MRLKLTFGTFLLPRRRSGHPEGYPDPAFTLYAPAEFRALATKVKRVLHRLLARLRDDHELA
jgi:hypothetical protein